MKKIGLIYTVYNTVTNKYYVGQTVQTLKERKRQHYKFAKSKMNYKFSNTLNKYDSNVFNWEIVENNILIDNLNDKEIFYIQKYNSFKKGYNSTPGGSIRFERKPSNRILCNVKELYNIKTKEIIKMNPYEFVKYLNVNRNSWGNAYKVFYNELLRFKNWILLERYDDYINFKKDLSRKSSSVHIDNKKYYFLNIKSNIIFEGSRKEFIQRFNLSKGCVSRLINKKAKIHKDWILKNRKDMDDRCIDKNLKE